MQADFSTLCRFSGAYRITHMQNVDFSRLKLHIVVALSAANKSARAISIESGMSPDTLGKFLKGETASLRADNMAKVLQVLNIPQAAVLGELQEAETQFDGPGSKKPFGVRFGGIVEAGPFRPDDGLNQDNEWRFIPVPPDPRYPVAAQYAFEVRGDSMTEAHIIEGMYALAVDVMAWERLHGNVPSGKLVVVARTRNGNPERELTVKRLRYFRDRMELQPESRNPVHEPLVFPLPLSDSDLQDVRIIAVLLQSTWIHG